MSVSNPSKTIALKGLIFTLFLFTICVSGSVLSSRIVDPHIAPSVLFFCSRLLFWICLGLVYLYCIKKEKQPFLLWEEKKYDIRFYIVSVIVVLLVIFVGSGCIQLVAHFFKWNSKSTVMNAMLKFGVPLKVFIAVTAAVVEELIFRGYLMSRLQLFFKSAWWPVIISALIFGMGHFRYGTFVNVAGPVFIGLVFAWYYQKYRNIKVLIICHFLIDFVALTFLR